MSKLRVHISTSLDGYVAGRHQSEQNPLGEGGEALHEWAFELEVMREAHGMAGGAVNASTPIMEEEIANVGAEIMGRGKFSVLRAADPGERTRGAAGGYNLGLFTSRSSS